MTLPSKGTERPHCIMASLFIPSPPLRPYTAWNGRRPLSLHPMEKDSIWTVGCNRGVGSLHMHTRTHAHTHTLKYNLLGPYNVTCVHVFMADHLGLDNWSVCSFLGRVSFASLCFAPLPIILSVGLRPHGLSFLCAVRHVHRCSLLRSCLVSHAGETS